MFEQMGANTRRIGGIARDVVGITLVDKASTIENAERLLHHLEPEMAPTPEPTQPRPSGLNLPYYYHLSPDETFEVGTFSEEMIPQHLSRRDVRMDFFVDEADRLQVEDLWWKLRRGPRCDFRARCLHLCPVRLTVHPPNQFIQGCYLG